VEKPPQPGSRRRCTPCIIGCIQIAIVPFAALAEMGHFKEAVQYVQRAAKALCEAAKEAFVQVKVSLQRLVELFVEAVTRVLAWIGEHRAYLFLMVAGAVAWSVVMNMWT